VDVSPSWGFTMLNLLFFLCLLFDLFDASHERLDWPDQGVCA
jgi:hypothetical protein